MVKVHKEAGGNFMAKEKGRPAVRLPKLEVAENRHNQIVAKPKIGAGDLDFLNAINDAANGFSTTVTAAAVASVVTLTAATAGADGNDITLSSTSTDVTLSGATLSGGLDADTITIGGTYVLTAVTGARTSGSDDFSVDGTTFDIGDDIAAAITDTSTHPIRLS